MASVSVDEVRDAINVSSAEVPDAKVLKMVKRAEVKLELETGRDIGWRALGFNITPPVMRKWQSTELRN